MSRARIPKGQRRRGLLLNNVISEVGGNYKCEILRLVMQSICLLDAGPGVVLHHIPKGWESETIRRHPLPVESQHDGLHRVCGGGQVW